MKIGKVRHAAVENDRSYAPDGSSVRFYRFAGAKAETDPHKLRGTAADDDADPSPAGDGELLIADIWRTTPSDPFGLGALHGAGGFDVHSVPGATVWRIVEMGPNREAPRHQTETVDHDLILAGEVELILDEERLLLVEGDAVVLPSVPHGWKTNARACTMAVLQLGVEPRKCVASQPVS